MYMDTENNQANRGRGRGTYQRGSSGRGGGSWNQGPARGGGFYQNYNGAQNYNGPPAPQSGRGTQRGRSYNGAWGNRGRSTRGTRGRGRAGGRNVVFDDPEDIEFLRALKGHSKQINALAVDPASQQIYSGSKDGTVRVWNGQTFQCERTVSIGGEIDSLLLVPGYLVVGFHSPGGEGVLKVWNMATAAEHTLVGHQGQVLCLAAHREFLFSGGQDTSIRVWRLNPTTSSFEAAGAMTMAQGGHAASVQCLIPLGQFLFSADWNGDIKVLNLDSGTFVQTISRAHTAVIMTLLSWESHLLSCSLDGTIKIWRAIENPGPDNVLDPVPIYSHPPAENNGEVYGAVLAMTGMQDSMQRSVLAASHNEENVCRLWELPTFAERGHLSQIRGARALTTGPDGLIMSGDVLGTIKLWRWRPPA